MPTDTPTEINLVQWIRRNTAGVFVVHGIGVGLLFLMHILITRSIGPANYGIFSHALALSTMISTIGVLGWPTALMRFAAEYDATANWNMLKGVFVRSYQISTSSTLLIGASFWIVTFFSGFPSEFKDNFRFAGLIIPFAGLNLLSRQALRGLHVILPSIIPPEIILPATVCLGVLIFSAVTAKAALWLYLFSAALCLLILLSMIYRRLKEKTSDFIGTYHTRLWVFTATPMMFSNLSQMIMKRVDIIMLGFLASMAEVGFFSVALRVAAVNMFILAAINTVVAPVLASSFRKGQYAQYYRVLFKSVTLSALGTMPIAAILIIWPGLALGFFGKEFIQHSSTILVLLTIAQFIDSATGPVGMALLMSGRERLVLFSSLPVSIAKIFINYMVITRYGGIGVAWVNIICVCMINGLNWFFLLRDRRVHLKSPNYITKKL